MIDVGMTFKSCIYSMDVYVRILSMDEVSSNIISNVSSEYVISMATRKNIT